MTQATPSVSTCDLCDAHGNDTTGAFRVLPPIFRSFGGRSAFAGPLSTIKAFEDNTSVRTAVAEPGQGRVLLVDGGGSLRRAMLGGNLAALATKNGWSGVVVVGAVRDVAELAACDLGVLAMACVPLATQKLQAGLRDVPVQVHGVWVRPGEWLYADADGVVVMASAAV
jgi:regulator of ribonuclease activity A